MEKLKGKHNHLLTQLLKVSIFGLILLLPFLVFMPTAFYYGFNEHAQVEIPQKVGIYETNEVNNVNDLEENKVYFASEFTIDLISLNALDDETMTMGILSCESFNIDSLAYGNSILDEIIVSQYNSNTNNEINITLTNEYCTIIFTNSDAHTSLYFDTEGAIVFYNIDFILYPNSLEAFKTAVIEFGYGSFDNITSSDFNVYEITETTSISENLSNSWCNMWDTPLFNWTNNTPFTATTNAFTSVFNISQTSGFYNLIAYIITIVCIYLIIDIILGIATTLTHMLAKQD